MSLQVCHPGRSKGSRGFSLVEALTALLVLALVMAAFLAAFVRFQRAATVQADLASATEDLRHVASTLVRLVRMAGCGGLPVISPDAEGRLRPLAVDLADNCEAGETLESAVSGGAWRFSCNRPPRAGTDVLRLRGVVTAPLFDLSHAAFSIPGVVSVPGSSPWTGEPQGFEAPASTDGRPFLLAMRSPLEVVAGGQRRVYGRYCVVGVDGDATIVDGAGGRTMNLAYNTGAYAHLNPPGASEVDARRVVRGGFLDDHVLFIAANSFGEPALYRARVKRSSGTVTAEEMVPNVCDLQVAFGCDVDGSGEVEDREWFLSRQRPDPPTGEQLVSLVQLRLNLVSRTQSPDLGWRDRLAPLENSGGLEDAQRRYRYRATTLRVNLRSHPTVGRS